MTRVIAASGLLLLSTFLPDSWLFAESQTTGPTMLLSYDEPTEVRNPIDVFMYFIPLTSPVRVALEKSAGNSQTAWITGYDLKEKNNGFKLKCDFTIGGNGYFINVFNHQDIIALNTRYMDPPKTTTNLDYMRFEGTGFGALEISGYRRNGEPVIETLSIEFSTGRAKSPVVIGLYSIDPDDGAYDYAKQYNQTKARVSYLSFNATKPGEMPKMRLKVSTFGNSATADGFFSPIKAVFANFFIDPIDVNPVGNTVLLDFAKAVFQQKELFVFPLAQSLDR